MSEQSHVFGWRVAGRTAPSQDDILPVVKRVLRREFPAGAIHIADLGCGNGYLTAELSALGHDVVGLDPSPDGIDVARKAYAGSRFEVASIYDDDLRERVGRSVDCVVSLEVVEHLYYPKRLFEQSYRLVRPGGKLVVSTPYHGFLKNLALSLTNHWDAHFSVTWDGGHIKFFSQKTLGDMARAAGFVDVRFDGAGRAPYLWKSMVLTATR